MQHSLLPKLDPFSTKIVLLSIVSSIVVSNSHLLADILPSSIYILVISL